MTVLKKCYVFCAAVLTAGLLAGGASAAAPDELDLLLEALKSGKPKLDVRLRYERADMDNQPRVGRAATIRTRLGYGTADYRGFTAYVEMEDVTAEDSGNYWDKVQTNNGRGVVADPDDTEINQVYLKYVAPESSPVPGTVIAGRQRIILDDARFIGNVGWRQDEQTYDAYYAKSGFGVEGLNLNVAYFNHIRRIFAEDKDANSSSTIVNGSYQIIPELKVAAFAYLLDLDDSLAGEASDTYGLRLNGKWAADDNITIGYQASWATQDEGDQTTTALLPSYDADYIMADGSFGWKDIGTIGVGYEEFEDDGQSFHTPLATAHKFNGWADVFLNNGGNSATQGGVGGLEDLYVYVAPALPCGVKSKIVYHQFESESGGADYGDEIDIVVSKALNKNWTILAKFADYDADSDSSNPAGFSNDVQRIWAQVNFKF